MVIPMFTQTCLTSWKMNSHSARPSQSTFDLSDLIHQSNRRPLNDIQSSEQPYSTFGSALPLQIRLETATGRNTRRQITDTASKKQESYQTRKNPIIKHALNVSGADSRMQRRSLGNLDFTERSGVHGRSWD